MTDTTTASTTMNRLKLMGASFSLTVLRAWKRYFNTTSNAFQNCEEVKRELNLLKIKHAELEENYDRDIRELTESFRRSIMDVKRQMASLLEEQEKLK